MSTLLKTADDAPKMANKIEMADKEIESLHIEIDLVTIYLGKQIITAFK